MHVANRDDGPIPLRFDVRPAGLKITKVAYGRNDLSSQHENYLQKQRLQRRSFAASVARSLMLDERTGLTPQDYTRKSGVAEAVILTPATAPTWCTNRAEL